MNFNQLMKQAQQMQKKLNKVQTAFNEKVFDFENSEQSVKGQMKGNMEIVRLELSDALLQEDKEVIEDVLVATLNNAKKTIAAQKEKELGAIAGDVNVPNLF